MGCLTAQKQVKTSKVSLRLYFAYSPLLSVRNPPDPYSNYLLRQPELLPLIFISSKVDPRIDLICYSSKYKILELCPKPRICDGGYMILCGRILDKETRAF